QLAGDGHAARERQPRIEKRGKLLREEQNIAMPPASKIGQFQNEGILLLDADINRRQPLLPQLACDSLIALAGQSASAKFPVGSYRFEVEARHVKAANNTPEIRNPKSSSKLLRNSHYFFRRRNS